MREQIGVPEHSIDLGDHLASSCGLFCLPPPPMRPADLLWRRTTQGACRLQREPCHPRRKGRTPPPRRGPRVLVVFWSPDHDGAITMELVLLALSDVMTH